MTRPFINRVAATALSLEEKVFMCVSWSKWLSSILTRITQQGPCQLQRPREKGHCEGNFHQVGATRVTADKATGPARLDAFRIVVAVEGLDSRHEAGVLRAVKACLIHNTLMHAPRIEIALDNRVPVTTG